MEVGEVRDPGSDKLLIFGRNFYSCIGILEIRKFLGNMRIIFGRG